MERLTFPNADLSHVENFLNKHSNFDGTIIANSLKKLAEYEDLEEQGLLVRLPCKVGDVVYCISDIGCHECERRYKECVCPCPKKIFDEKFDYSMMPDMGIDNFATKEEAERKLAELEGSKDE